MATKKTTAPATTLNNVTLTHLEKVFYPKVKFTKGDVIDYYNLISAYILPHLKDRPITMKRFPDGVTGIFFYEKQKPSYAPKWIKSVKVKKEDGEGINYCIVNDVRSLLWMSNIANLEFHTFLHKAQRLTLPTAMAFDLDPGAPANIIDCCEVALLLKKIFDKMKLKSFAKTSGSKGLQIFIPLNTPCTHELTKRFAHEIALLLELQQPELVVSKMQKILRTGKVLIDWSQNDIHKTTACVYTLRAKDKPYVSTPITWKEVLAATKHRDAKKLAFLSKDVLNRVKRQGDLFAEVLTLKQRLPKMAQITKGK